MTLEILKKQEYWDSEWEKVFDHYQQDVRHAYYINAILKDDENKILEMAAGSFRDFAKLNELGKNCYAFDYSPKSVEEAKKYHSHLKDDKRPFPAFITRAHTLLPFPLRGYCRSSYFKPGKSFSKITNSGIPMAYGAISYWPK